MARKIINPIRHQGATGQFTPFRPGEIVPDDHPLADHWFILENSVPYGTETFADERPAQVTPWAPTLIESPSAALTSGQASESSDQSTATIPLDPEPETDADKAIEALGETRDHLIAQAEARGVQIDRRWGVAKLKAALETAP